MGLIASEACGWASPPSLANAPPLPYPILASLRQVERVTGKVVEGITTPNSPNLVATKFLLFQVYNSIYLQIYLNKFIILLQVFYSV